VPLPLQGKPGATQLFRWVAAGSAGSWELASADARARFYDINEDSERGPPEWHMEVEGLPEEPNVIVQDHFIFEEGERKCTFFSEEGSWALTFPTTIDYGYFLQKFNHALAENTYGRDGAPTEVRAMLPGTRETEASLQHWIEDVDMPDVPTEEELALAKRAPNTPVGQRAAAVRDDEAIRSIILGATDRSYVLAGEGTFEVMKNVRGGMQDAKVSFCLTTPRRPRLSLPAGTPNSGGAGQAITPSSVLLASGERKMNLLSRYAATSLFHADIETGKVVNEFSFTRDGVDIPIRDIASDTKSSQMEDRTTFLGLDDNRLTRWDMRMRDGVAQHMESPSTLTYVGGKDYSRGTKFSCMATSGAGYTVVGSIDGKVRLYSEKTLTQAKTSLPSLGLPITSVDVTHDGRWVLATTKSYLMVVKTTYSSGESGRELCGFTERMGQNKPAPRLLRLTTPDVARTAGAPLEKGHFSWVTERGHSERWIVASCGNFTVLWNFRAVKAAKPVIVSLGGLTTVSAYNLIPKSEHVVDSVFMHEKFCRTAGGVDEAAMVVATKRAVYTVADSDGDDDDDADI
jgi:hypothetical protein